MPGIAPALGLCVVTCMDARLQPTRTLELERGDAHVIRNAGGCARDALRSILLSRWLTEIGRIMVIKHTDCAMQGPVDEQMADALRTAGVPDPGLEWRGFASVEEALADDVAFLRSRPELRDVAVEGWIYDVDRWVLRRVST